VQLLCGQIPAAATFQPAKFAELGAVDALRIAALYCRIYVSVARYSRAANINQN